MPLPHNPILPDDVMLDVLGRIDIDTLLACRLLDRRIHHLVNSHINGLSRLAARVTFPSQQRIFAENELQVGADVRTCLLWLKRLRYYQLAAIFLECRKNDWGRCLAAEDPLGAEIRSVIAQGWQVMDRFALIAKEVSLVPPGDLPGRAYKRGRGHDIGTEHDIANLRELETCARWMKLVETLSLDALKGYQFLRYDLVDEVFRGHRHWVFAYFCRVGVKGFWRLWWTEQHQDCLSPGEECLQCTLSWPITEARCSIRFGLAKIDDQILLLRSAVGFRTNDDHTAQRGWSNTFEWIAHQAFERELLTAGEEEDPPPRSFEKVPFKQRLEPELTPALIRRWPYSLIRANPEEVGVLYSNWSPEGTSGIRYARTREPQVRLPNSKEYDELYEQWKEDWKRRSGWKEQT